MKTQKYVNKRLKVFKLWIVLLLGILVVFLITQRLSKDTLSALGGLVSGVLAVLPAAGLAFLLWRREIRRQQEKGQHRPPPKKT